MTEDEGYFIVRMLSDGRDMNILTQSGADAFISGEGVRFITTNINQGAVLTRQKLAATGQHLSARERRQMTDMLIQTYVMFGCIAANASPDVFAREVGRDQLECLIDHTCDVFSKLTKNKRYIKTGVLHQQYDQELLDAIIPHMKHLTFVKLALEKDLLVVLAKFCAARKKTNLPCPDITESILGIANNCRVSLRFDGVADEKIFKKLEATGILGQAFRCYTQPSSHPDAPQGNLDMLDILMACPLLVKQKLNTGTPTGDILADIIAGKDGYDGRRNEKVMMRLRNLQKFSSMSNKKVNSKGRQLVGKTCRNCNKTSRHEDFQQSLLVCSRCQNTYYCSKECQRADWKEHKKTCTPPDKQLAKTSAAMQRTVTSFIAKNYYEIMKEIDRICREDNNITKKDLIMEMDLFASNKGCAPALKDPPEFKVGITSRYLEGTRPDEPDWFYKGTEVYDDNVKKVLVGLQDHYRRMTNNHLLTLARYPDGSSGVLRVQVNSEDTGVPLFSDEALDAFSRAMRGDDSLLGQIYGEQQRIYIQRRRDMDNRVNRSRQGMNEDDGGDGDNERFRARMAVITQRLMELLATRDQLREVMMKEVGSSDDDSDNDEIMGEIMELLATRDRLREVMMEEVGSSDDDSDSDDSMGEIID